MSSPNTDPEKVRTMRQRWYSNNDGAAWARERSQRIRDEVIEGYGWVCACCGEGEPSFLTIDHVNNNGAEERKKWNAYGTNLYYFLIRNNFPPEYQLLCQNCNASKQRLGECAHKLKARLI